MGNSVLLYLWLASLRKQSFGWLKWDTRSSESACHHTAIHTAFQLECPFTNSARIFSAPAGANPPTTFARRTTQFDSCFVCYAPQTCFEQGADGKLTAIEICDSVEAVCNASAWRSHYENFHPIQINNLVSSGPRSPAA